jgi:pyruvyltransferase
MKNLHITLKKLTYFSFILAIFFCSSITHLYGQGLPLYYWQQPNFVNFGDYLSLKLVERIVGLEVPLYKKKMYTYEKKLLAVGSILYFANNNDVIWGSGTNGKVPEKNKYNFTNLDVRAVRGPLTRQFLVSNWDIDCPEIYGDPALLVPYFFPEFKRKKKPKYDYIVIPHYAENSLFPKNDTHEIVYPTEPLFTIFEKIINSSFVISSSLHGIIVAESFGIPARYLRVTEKEPLLKYQDYYIGTNRPHFKFATSVEEALLMGGEPPFECDLEKLYNAFPFDYWPHVTFKKPIFKKTRGAK